MADDIVLGDNGFGLWNAAGVLTHIETADPTLADQELIDWLMDGAVPGD